MSVVTIPAWTLPDFLADNSPDEIYEQMKQTDIGNGRTIEDAFATEQGSMFYDLCYPSAIQKSLIVTEQMALALQAAFPQYSFGSFLDLHGNTYGLTRLQATHSAVSLTLAGTVGTTIPEGALFSTVPDSNGFAVKFATDAESVIPAGGSVVVATTSTAEGSNQNVIAGSVTNIVSAMAGLTTATNPLPAIGGSDVETDTAFRTRILQKTANEPGAGSMGDYQRWASAVDGVGHAKVVPDWNTGYGDGYGAVKILLLSPEGEPATQEVSDNVQAIIWPATPAAVDLTVTTDGACELTTAHLFGTSSTTPAGILFHPVIPVTIAGAGDTTVACIAVEPGPRGNVAIEDIDTVVSAPDAVTGVENAAAATGGAATYEGYAPFGAIVTCKPYDTVPIIYAVRVVYDSSGISESTIIDAWREAIQTYYSDSKEDGTNGTLRIAKVLGLLMGIENVRDVQLMYATVNGVAYTSASDTYSFGADEYPVTADIRLMWAITFLVETSAHVPISGVAVEDAAGVSLGSTNGSGNLTVYVESGSHLFSFAHSSYQPQSTTIVVAGADVAAVDATVEMTAV